MTIRDEILSAQDVRREEVHLAAPGVTVWVHSLTAADHDGGENEVTKDGKPNLRNFRARLVVKCVRDAEGNRVFSDEDAEALGQLSSGLVQRLFVVAKRVSGLDVDDESLEKNL